MDIGSNGSYAKPKAHDFSSEFCHRLNWLRNMLPSKAASFV